MSLKTKKDLRNLFIYQVYVRNHNQSGTFKEMVEDLDRIKEMGVDIVYFVEDHPHILRSIVLQIVTVSVHRCSLRPGVIEYRVLGDDDV